MTDHSFPLRPLFLSLGPLSALVQLLHGSLPLSIYCCPSFTTGPHTHCHSASLSGWVHLRSQRSGASLFLLLSPLKSLPHPVPVLVLVASKKIPWTGWLKQPNIYFSVPEARSLKSGCRHTWVWGRVLFLVCKWLSSCYILTQGERWYFFFALIKDTNPIHEVSMFMTKLPPQSPIS